MARIMQIRSREELPPAAWAAWDEIARSRGGVRGPFSVFLHSPELAVRTARLGSYIRFESPAPRWARLFVCLVTARHFDCQYAWSGNEDDARGAGVRDEAIRAVRDRSAPARLEGDERILFDLAAELLVWHRVSDATLNAVRDRYGLSGLVDLVGTIGYYSHLAMTLNAFEVDPLPHFPRLLPEIGRGGTQ